MNKAQLVEKISTDAEISKAAATRALDAFTGAVTSSLKEGNSVALVGFGTFSVKERAARTGLFQYLIVLLELVVTHKQVQKSKFQQRLFQALNQVKVLKTK